MISGDTSPANVAPANSASLRIAVHQNLISIGKCTPFHAVPRCLRSELRDIILHCDNETYFKVKMRRIDLLPSNPAVPQKQPLSVFVRETASFRIAVARYPAGIIIVVYCLPSISPDPKSPPPGGLRVTIDETQEAICLPFAAVIGNRLRKLFLLSAYQHGPTDESLTVGIGHPALSPSCTVKDTGIDLLEKTPSEKQNAAENWFVSDVDEIIIPIELLSLFECNVTVRALNLTRRMLRPWNCHSPRAMKHLHSYGACGTGRRQLAKRGTFVPWRSGSRAWHMSDALAVLLLVRDHQSITLH